VLTGISKGGFGGGAGGAATPLLAMVIPPAQGAAIMLPVLCVMDVFGIRAYLWRWDARLVRITVSAGLIGCAAGALAFGHLDDNWTGRDGSGARCRASRASSRTRAARR
jgi:uncharacterized membrane protein YfcA